MKKLLKIALVIGLIGTVAVVLSSFIKRDATTALGFETSKITRDNLLVSIDATGTIEPEEVIDVGAQVAGMIVSFGTDADGKTIDYRSPVEEGMVLARIDDSTYRTELEQAQAQVQSAQANLKKAEADLEQLKARFRQAERDWNRAQKLGPSEALAQTSYDSYLSAYEIAKANVTGGDAAITQAKASLAQAQGGLERVKRDLEHCIITSPVKGLIIDRRVNIGQTVVASMSAPSLFLIAKDLKRMQIWVPVNEADIGKIHPDQNVTFTVDAFPDEMFTGKVAKVRLNASLTQNVVTYTVEIVTDNSSGRLIPYLSANVKFEVQRRDDVLLVSNAALRYTPATDKIAPEFRNNAPTQQTAKRSQRRSEGGTSERSQMAKTAAGVVWIAQGEFVKPIPVKLGISDGTKTEVESEGISEGMEIVTGVKSAGSKTKDKSDSSSTTTNPFAPKMPAPPRGAGGPPR